jgi:hypothetical protein
MDKGQWAEIVAHDSGFQAVRLTKGGRSGSLLGEEASCGRSRAEEERNLGCRHQYAKLTVLKHGCSEFGANLVVVLLYWNMVWSDFPQKLVRRCAPYLNVSRRPTMPYESAFGKKWMHLVAWNAARWATVWAGQGFAVAKRKTTSRCTREVHVNRVWNSELIRKTILRKRDASIRWTPIRWMVYDWLILAYADLLWEKNTAE